MLRFADGGGRSYVTVGASNVNILALWTSVNNATTWSVVASNGRTTGSCLRAAITAAQTSAIRKSLDNQATLGIAFAFRTSLIVGGTTVICALEDATNTQIDLRLTTDGILFLTRNGTVLTGATNILSTNAWYHIELKCTIHPTAGNYELRVNGTTTGWIPSQGGTANTRATANSFANGVRLGSQTNGPFTANLDFDDVIVYDAQTTDANGNADISDFIGDCGVTVLTPSGAGTTTQFTPDSGTNYARLTEATPDTTSYVESSTVGNKDTYAMGDLPANISAVKSIATLYYATKTDVGSRQMGSVVRSGGTNYTHPTGIDLGNSYLYYFRNWGSNPNTATSWTPTTVNALEAGQVVNT